MAAYRNKIKTVIIPKGNEPDLTEISEEVKKHVEFKSVTRLSEVFESALI